MRRQKGVWGSHGGEGPHAKARVLGGRGSSEPFCVYLRTSDKEESLSSDLGAEN